MAEPAQTVAIPIEWFLGTMTGAGAIIAFMYRTIFKLQEDRRTADLTAQKDILTALNNSTDAINRLADGLTREKG